MSDEVETITFSIKELDPDIIPPCSARANDPEYGGSKIVLIGRPGSGKSSCIASLLYAKKHIFPVGMVMSGTEATTGFFKKIFPSTFVFNEYREDMLESFIKRQKIAKEHLPNPWGILLVDDCVESRKVLTSDIQMNLFKMGRHMKLWYLLSMQSPTDLPSAIKTSIDGVFIFREPLHTARKIIWENYASIIPKEYFNQIMDQITNDHTALFILNQNTSNDWQDSVFWYKAPLAPSGWKFGSKEYKEYHNERYDDEYTEGF
jgi:hypothetical protein